MCLYHLTTFCPFEVATQMDWLITSKVVIALIAPQRGRKEPSHVSYRTNWSNKG